MPGLAALTLMVWRAAKDFLLGYRERVLDGVAAVRQDVVVHLDDPGCAVPGHGYIQRHAAQRVRSDVMPGRWFVQTDSFFRILNTRAAVDSSRYQPENTMKLN